MMFPRWVMVVAMVLGVSVAHAHDDGAGAPPNPEDAAAEAIIHTLPGAARAGEPTVATGPDTTLLSLTVLDAATGEPTPCRVNVIGADGNYYEPEHDRLTPWSLHRLGNRTGKGPFRYYGWFFYSQGTSEVRVPRGAVRVEVWKGFEYRPVTLELMAEDDRLSAEARLERVVDMAARGWYSGDPHLHLDRTDKEQEARILDLQSAEDVRFGYILAMNDPRTYTGAMHAQIWPQAYGLGRGSTVTRGAYTLSSGQEYRNNTFGHILLLMGDDLVYAGQSLDPNRWPPFIDVARETHRLKGYAIHAHGGYEKEIYADYINGDTDGVELLQFAVYRGIGLEGWYHILNAGYRFPAVGASDYPYCRAFGDCRTYARIDGDPTPASWAQAVVDGKSFVTTGPLPTLTVDGKEPGDTVQVDADTKTVSVALQLASEVAVVNTVEILVNGAVAFSRTVPAEGPVTRIEIAKNLPLTGSAWIAARAYHQREDGLPDVEAHTNPVYVIQDDQPVRRAESARWLLAKLDERIGLIEAMDFAEKGDVLALFRASRAKLAARAE
jgi:hypothetical protein